MELPVSALTVKLLPRNLSTARLIARMQVRIYPKEMQEDAREILPILASTDLSRGLFSGKNLLGYALFERGDEKEGTVYLYDFAILPQFQSKGLGSKLLREVLALPWRRKLKVRMHVRKTSYPLLTNEEKLRAAGYRLIRVTLLHDWYFKEFGIHEDAHELVLQPLPHKPPKVSAIGVRVS
jgi:GNAT superfamily N-acetyltransferase